MTIILGIDPGLQHTGWGVIRQQHNSISYVASGTISPMAGLPMPERLRCLSDGLQEVLFTYQPHEAAIEETFVNKNALSSLKLGQARGALILTVSLAGIPVKEYAATLVKKSVVGVGRAEKIQVMTMVNHILPGAKPHTADAADALAVAICHANHARIHILTA